VHEALRNGSGDCIFVYQIVKVTTAMALEPEIIERIQKLEAKYATMGQDLASYLDGLLMSNTTTYWDYIRLDTLLSLQEPKTDFPDEQIFIMYHQITELYFKLVLHEMDQVAHNGRDVDSNGEDKGWHEKLDVKLFTTRVTRMNNYFDALISSFNIMVDGMEPDQFLKFRMALLPASGFQSAQYRMIEICSTDFANIVHKDRRDRYAGSAITNSMLDEMFEHSYWKGGATELATGEKTLTLRMFEKKYTKDLVALAKQYREINLWKKFESLSEEDQQNEELKNALRLFDVSVNINWPLSHYKSAVRYLQKDTSDVAATGGTNWQKYLPPRFQKRIFYPGLWTEEERENWGKGWVMKEVFQQPEGE
jgi:tryptophan 2,3-dioxygenase